MKRAAMAQSGAYTLARARSHDKVAVDSAAEAALSGPARLVPADLRRAMGAQR
ncbi:MAG: hypothetical protein QM796_10940 [Chthoniobacteraceae bacterium]